MELMSGSMGREDYLLEIADLVELLRDAGVERLLVAYGPVCDCPEERRGEVREMPLDGLLPFIDESEAANYYEVGEDDLQVKDAAGRFEILLCHESDIHFISEDVNLLNRITAFWPERITPAEG